MNTPFIESVIEAVVDDLVPADPANGFFVDVESYFCGHDAFFAAHTHLLNEPKCLVELRGQVDSRCSSLKDIASLMYEIWMSLSYNYFEASSCIHYRQASVLRFLTVPSFEDYFISGRMIISSTQHRELVDQFEHNFAGVVKLNDLPEGLEPLSVK